MIIFLFLHVIRVFFTFSFRNYRWGAWMVGVCLLGLTLGMGFTGYSLVYEQMSYWAITVTSNIIATVPLLGETFKRLFLAGSDINDATLSRMYALHVQIMPALLAFLGIVHLFFVRLMGMYQPGNEEDRVIEKSNIESKGYYHFFPDHLLSETAMFLYLLLIIIMLSIIMPAKMGAPADPLVTPEHIKPEWYFYPFFHLLKLVPGIAGVMIMSLLGMILFIYPILDHYILQKIDRILKIKVEIGTIIGISVIIIYLAWALLEAKI